MADFCKGKARISCRRPSPNPGGGVCNRRRSAAGLGILILILLGIAACGKKEEADASVEPPPVAVAPAEAEYETAEPADAAASPSPQDAAPAATESESPPPPKLNRPPRDSAAASVDMPISDRVEVEHEPASAPAEAASMVSAQLTASAKPMTANMDSRLQWTAWFEKKGCLLNSRCDNPGLAREINPDSTYRLALGLSGEPIDGISAPADPQVANHIGQESSGESELWILPIFSDSRIQPSSLGGVSGTSMTVHRARLRLPGEVMEQLRTQYAAGEIDVAAYARALAAGHLDEPIWFRVSPNASGCAFMALSIWDAGRSRSLDSLLVPIPITQGRVTADCGKDPVTGTALRGGWQALIAKGGSLTSAAGAAVQISEAEFEGERHSFAVFAFNQDGRITMAGWEMSRKFSEPAIQNDLANAIRKARETIQNRGIDAPKAYANAAGVLANVIFGAQQEAGQDQADIARAALRRLTAKGATPITLTAQFTRPGAGDSSRFFLPLRLLAANGAEYSEQGFSEVQPLNYRQGAGEACIRRWTIIRSPPAMGETDSMPAMRPSWLAATLTTRAELESYFAKQKPQVGLPTGSSDGLILLVHHGSEGFKFEGKDDAYPVSQIQRDFPPGSAVVLLACSVTGPDSADGLIGRLNRHGFDSIVASPFAVDSKYAQRLLKRFYAELEQSYSENEGSTIAKLFHSAVVSGEQAATRQPQEGDSLAAALGEAPAIEEASPPGEAQQGLEYLLVGDPGIRLCTQATEPVP